MKPLLTKNNSNRVRIRIVEAVVAAVAVVAIEEAIRILLN
jgi:hypothetical protein